MNNTYEIDDDHIGHRENVLIHMDIDDHPDRIHEYKLQRNHHRSVNSSISFIQLFIYIYVCVIVQFRIIANLRFV